MKTELTQLKKNAAEYFKKLSKREKTIITVAVCMGFVTVGYQIYQPVRIAFESQSERLTGVQRDMESVSLALARYSKLKARQQAIENAYKEVEIKEGALSHLENLVRTKAGITSGFTIKDKPVREFGGGYEQAPFSVRFVITDLPRLVDFLKEIVVGQRPLILANLDVTRRPAGDSVEVEMEVSSIRKIAKVAEPSA